MSLNGAGIFSHNRVEGQQHDSFNRRLGYQQTIKEIFMNRWQALDGDNVGAEDRQLLIPVVQSGCPLNILVFYYTPWRFPGCLACELNSTHC
jgi:hypothetical protein